MTKSDYVCSQCGKPTSLADFNKSTSTFYSFTERLPICKNCLTSLYKFYKEKYHSSKLATQRICMAFDLYYSDKILNKCGDNDDVFMGNYIKRLNMKQYKGKAFDNSLDEGFTFEDIRTIPDSEDFDSDGNNKEKKEKPKQEDIAKWGDGFSVAEYKLLNSHYQFLKEANPKNSDNQEIFIIDLCYTKMQQMKALKNDRVDDYNKLTESYRKSFEKAGLKTVRNTEANDDDCWGVWVRRIEQYTPAEYYKNKKLFQDHDNIGDYFKRFVLRPIKNLMFNTQERDYEFYVKDEEEEDTDDAES